MDLCDEGQFVRALLGGRAGGRETGGQQVGVALLLLLDGALWTSSWSTSWQPWRAGGPRFTSTSETKRVTLTFADKVALNLAMRKHAPITDEEELRRQLTVTREGALAFFSWASALLYAYLDSTGTPLRYVLEPE